MIYHYDCIYLLIFESKFISFQFNIFTVCMQFELQFDENTHFHEKWEAFSINTTKITIKREESNPASKKSSITRWIDVNLQRPITTFQRWKQVDCKTLR